MQKFPRYFFYASVFVIFLFSGIFLAQKIISVFNAQEAENNENKIQATNQIQLIIFFIDEMEVETPKLSGIWSVNIFEQDPKQITFMELTGPENENFLKISQQFSLDEQKNPNLKTIDTLERLYKMKWDGVVILDQQASKKFSKWISENVAEDPSTIENLVTNPSPVNFCDYLTLHDQSPISTFDLNILNNTDFHTTLSFEDIIGLTKIITSSPPPKCKIVPVN